VRATERSSPFSRSRVWEATWRVVVPFARPGILWLYLWPALAFGDNMAVTMVIGNTPIIALLFFLRLCHRRRSYGQRAHRARSHLHYQSLIEVGTRTFLLT